MKTILTNKCKDIIFKQHGINLTIKGYMFFVDKERILAKKSEIPNLKLSDVYKKNPLFNESICITNPLKNNKNLMDNLFDVTYIPAVEVSTNTDIHFGTYKIRFDQSLNPLNDFGFNSEDYYNNSKHGFDAIILIGQKITENVENISKENKCFIAAFLIPDSTDELYLPKISDDKIDSIQYKSFDWKFSFSMSDEEITELKFDENYQNLLDNTYVNKKDTIQLLNDIIISDVNCDTQIDTIKKQIKEDFPTEESCWYNNPTNMFYIKNRLILSDNTNKINTPWTTDAKLVIQTDKLNNKPQLMLSYLFKDNTSNEYINNGVYFLYNNNFTIAQTSGKDNLQIDLFTTDQDKENSRCFKENIKPYNLSDYENVKSCPSYMRLYSTNSKYNNSVGGAVFKNILEYHSNYNTVNNNLSTTNVNLFNSNNNILTDVNNLVSFNSNNNKLMYFKDTVLINSNNLTANKFDYDNYQNKNNVFILADNLNSTKLFNKYTIIGVKYPAINKNIIETHSTLIGFENLTSTNFSNIVFGSYNQNNKNPSTKSHILNIHYSSFKPDFDSDNKQNEYGDTSEKVLFAVSDGFCIDNKLLDEFISPFELIHDTKNKYNQVKRINVFSVENDNKHAVILNTLLKNKNIPYYEFMGRVVSSNAKEPFTNIEKSFILRSQDKRTLFTLPVHYYTIINNTHGIVNVPINHDYKYILNNTLFSTDGIYYANNLVSNCLNKLSFDDIITMDADLAKLNNVTFDPYKFNSIYYQISPNSINDTKLIDPINTACMPIKGFSNNLDKSKDNINEAIITITYTSFNKVSLNTSQISDLLNSIGDTFNIDTIIKKLQEVLTLQAIDSDYEGTIFDSNKLTFIIYNDTPKVKKIKNNYNIGTGPQSSEITIPPDECRKIFYNYGKKLILL